MGADKEVICIPSSGDCSGRIVIFSHFNFKPSILRFGKIKLSLFGGCIQGECPAVWRLNYPSTKRGEREEKKQEKERAFFSPPKGVLVIKKAFERSTD